MKKIEEGISKKYRDKILKEFPTKESLEEYWNRNLLLPHILMDVVSISDISYEELKEWLYGKEEIEEQPLIVESEVMGEILKQMESLDLKAKNNTTDPKVYVGASVGFIKDNQFFSLGEDCNRNNSYNERDLGQTYREFLFNSRDKKYRPWDKIIHAEENAIVKAINLGREGLYDTAIVTRYPCEKCAQLMVYKGIKKVYYGRPFEITKETKKIFKDAGVKVYHVKEYVGDENDDNK